MAKATWDKSIIICSEEIEVVSLHPRVAKSKYFVEIYEDAGTDKEGCPLVKIECDSDESAEAVKMSLIEASADVETFTSLSEL